MSIMLQGLNPSHHHKTQVLVRTATPPSTTTTESGQHTALSCSLTASHWKWPCQHRARAQVSDCVAVSSVKHCKRQGVHVHVYPALMGRQYHTHTNTHEGTLNLLTPHPLVLHQAVVQSVADAHKEGLAVRAEGNTRHLTKQINLLHRPKP